MSGWRSITSRGSATIRSRARLAAARSGKMSSPPEMPINSLTQRTQEVVTAIRHVTEVAAEISNSSAEQSAGVAQIGEAITLMDHTTQQNAALVEESAAAAESLKEQARQLVQAVLVFKLPAAADGGVAVIDDNGALMVAG